MHIQVVRFNLKDMSEAGYRKLCDDLAPTFAAVPGLVAKVWLADPATNAYGGVYTWHDRAAMDTYFKSDLCKGVMSSPNLINITSSDFNLMEGPTRVTRGSVAVAA
jgi:quinol monooxygenase YgiN